MFSSNFAFLPKSNMSLNLALSHFNTENEFGVRDEGSLNPLQDIRFDDFSEYTRPIKGFNNPTGWPDFFVTEGEYPEYAWSNSDQWFGRFTSKVQFNPSHQVYLGLSGTRFSIEKFHVIYPYHVVPIIDDYAFQPGEYSFFIEDGIEHQDLFVKAGLRFDRYDYDTGTTYNIFSPRVGFSFMIKGDLLMRANIGRYVQPPLFDQLYTFQGYETRTLPDDNPILVGNPHLEPERTIATEIGFQGQLSEGINATTTFFYKDVTNLIGTRLIRAVPVDYSTFMNVEFANVKGIEFVLSLYQPLIEGHLSYTLSYARGTSSYATEGYSEYIIEDPDTILNFPKIDYPLDFDQRHRIFIRTTFHLPYQIDLFSYLYLGSGFPYTPLGGKGDPATMNTIQSPFRKDLGISITRTFDLGKGNVALSFEILNALDFRDVKYVYPATGLPNDNGVRVERNDFAGGWSLFNKGYYHPSQDLNNDGYVSGRESYLSYVTANFYSMDWPNNYGPSRRYRIGLKIVF
ncbi:MAG TPA: hypothetical protein EYP58_05910 [bacterium (Candidatus Stahlbacteria)]|nr:hypothetical protein [Candidatus Stahlbacteria bacterium]